MLVNIPVCGYCHRLIYPEGQPVVMASGSVWHRDCAMQFRKYHSPRCGHLDMTRQEHLNLPCAWPKCSAGHDGPEYYLPIEDVQQVVFDPDPMPPMKTPDAVYRRVVLQVSELAQLQYHLPPMLYRWDRQQH